MYMDWRFPACAEINVRMITLKVSSNHGDLLFRLFKFLIIFFSLLLGSLRS